MKEIEVKYTLKQLKRITLGAPVQWEHDGKTFKGTVERILFDDDIIVVKMEDKKEIVPIRKVLPNER